MKMKRKVQVPLLRPSYPIPFNAILRLPFLEHRLSLQALLVESVRLAEVVFEHLGLLLAVEVAILS